jgi:hypothetical protein
MYQTNAKGKNHGGLFFSVFTFLEPVLNHIPACLGFIGVMELGFSFWGHY